jgi:hypothetical protein
MDELEMLEALWHFYEKQDDSDNKETAKICANLIIYHDFNIDDLPDILRQNVTDILKQHYEKRYYEFEDERLYVGAD